MNPINKSASNNNHTSYRDLIILIAFLFTLCNFAIVVSTCPDNCSGNGNCSSVLQSCICNTGWTGNRCERSKNI